MAEGKKTFIFYSDWINMVREMPDQDAGALLKHILSYVNDENPETDNLLVKMAFGHMKPLIKADLKKWEVIREKRKALGSLGGLAKAKQNLAKAKQNEAVNVNVNVNDNVNGNVNVNDNRESKADKPPRSKFIKPTFEELKDYFFEKGLSTEQSVHEAEKFLDYYTSVGWKVGKNPMKDWKATVRTWLKRFNENNYGKHSKANTKEQLFDFAKNIDRSGY